MITNNASSKIKKYNQLCLHYNLVANSVYTHRQECKDPFSNDYLQYIVAALISFDMGRMMGEGLSGKYDVTGGGFASRLLQKLQLVRYHLSKIVDVSILDADIGTFTECIQEAYRILAEGGLNSLSATGTEFHISCASGNYEYLLVGKDELQDCWRKNGWPKQGESTKTSGLP